MRSFASSLLQGTLSLALYSTLAFGASTKRATVCNGHTELCNRSYGNVSYVGAHDSYAVGVGNIFTNQDYNITQQLNDGVRMLQMQTHNDSGVIQLCHTSCAFFNGGPLSTYLATVKTWMDANPNDVVSLLIVNNDEFTPSAYDEVFQGAGLKSLSYSPPSASITYTEWPTLGSMIEAGTRLVTFMDTQADFSEVPYIISEFINVWETPFDVTDQSFPCPVNRTQGNPSEQLYLINHFLDHLVLGEPAPTPSEANVTNAVSGYGSLGEQVQTCTGEYGRPPNFLLVDFYEFGGGSVFEVAANINGVTYSPTTPVATPIPSSSSGGPATGSGSGSGSGSSGSGSGSGSGSNSQSGSGSSSAMSLRESSLGLLSAMVGSVLALL